MKVLGLLMSLFVLVGSCYAGPTYILKPPNYPFHNQLEDWDTQMCVTWCEMGDANRRCLILRNKDTINDMSKMVPFGRPMGEWYPCSRVPLN